MRILFALLLVASSITCSAGALEAYGNLPLAFEENRGQTDGEVAFLARGNSFQLYLTPTEAVYRFRDDVVRMQLVGANRAALGRGADRLPGESHYLRGSDPRGWVTHVPHYRRVELLQVYPGIDLAYYGHASQLEYDFILSPGANPRAIAIDVRGARKLEIDREGRLLIATSSGNLVWNAPSIYQEIRGEKRSVRGGYVLRGKNRVGFRIASYDRRETLVIDPVLAYSTLIGGTGHDAAHAVAVDASGSAVIAGFAGSTDFPTTSGAYNTASGGVFVAKLNPAGSALVYSTFLGAGRAFGIALQGGNAYVTGQAPSGFPTTAGAVSTPLLGDNVFVTKLAADGSSLVYSALFGGVSKGFGIAVDAAGNAHVTGETNSPSFPTTAGAFRQTGPMPGMTPFPGSDAFFLKLNASGTALMYSTYLGSSESDEGLSVAVDGSGKAYVTGLTTGRSAVWNGTPAAATPFPTTPSSYQPTFVGAAAAFVTKFDPSASGAASVVYSTLFGGDDTRTRGHAIAVDAAGSAYITGLSDQAFPVTAGAYGAATPGGGTFVAKLHPSGSSLVYSARIAGTEGWNIALDAANNAFVTGIINGPFVTENPIPGITATDLFLTHLNATGSDVYFSSNLHGSQGGTPFGLAVDASGAAYVAGSSGTFTGTPGAYQTVRKSAATEAFVTKVISNGPPVANPGADRTVRTNVAFTLDGSASSDPEGDSLTYVWRDQNGTIVNTAGTATVTLTRTPGVYSFTLTVSDGIASSSASVVITVEAWVNLNFYGSSTGRVASSDGTISCVTGQTCAAPFSSSSVTFSAFPDTGAMFYGWVSPPSCAGTTATSCTFTLTDDPTAVGARFDVQQWTLTVSNGGNGKVTSTPAGIDCGTTCSATYPYNTAVTLQAVPDSGYLFDQWSGACTGTQLTCVVTLDVSKAVTASFKQIALSSLTVTPPSASMTVGDTRKFTVTGLFSDGSTRIVNAEHSLEASDSDTCAITQSGLVKCLGTTPSSAFEKAISLSSGTSHICALFADGTVNCEGFLIGVTGAVAIASQSTIACALLSSGSVQCWDMATSTRTPMTITGINNNAVAIGAEAGGGACAVLADGSVTCWNGSGGAVPVAGVSNAIAATYGVKHGCALINNGTVMCWGDNDHGQLGNGQIVPQSGPPTPATWVKDSSGVLMGAISIVAGDYHSCALLANGTAKCWGLGTAVNNQVGGTSGATFFDTPFAIPFTAIPQAMAIAAGDQRSCVTLPNGSVWCEGQGIGLTQYAPAPIAAFSNVVGVSWASSDPSVVKIMAGGIAVGVGAGSATVTAAFGSSIVSMPIMVTAGSSVSTRAVSADPTTLPVFVTFPSVSHAGSTTLAPAACTPTPPSGFQVGNPPACFSLSSTASFTPPATVCFTYDPAAFTGTPDLFHFETGAWQPITTTVNSVDHIVCGETDTFSPFALFGKGGSSAPIANAGPDSAYECTSPRTTPVTLDGSRSSDPDGDTLTYAWQGTFGRAEGVRPTVNLPLGTTDATLTVSDGSASSTDSVRITVRDTRAPLVSAATAQPSSLWPPNGKFVPVTLTATVADTCDASARCRIQSVRSNEPSDRQDVEPDWQITGDLSLKLRAERWGQGKGRIYTITLRCVDASNNSSTRDVIVTVPHNR